MPGPQLVLVEADAYPEHAAEHVTVLLAAVAQQRVLETRLGARWVDDREELDDLVAVGGQSLPRHARLEVDHRPVPRRGDPRVLGGRCDRPRAELGRLGLDSVEEITHREAEHRHEGPECRDRRCHLVALDLGDEAR